MVEISASILDVKEEESAKTFYNLEVAKTDYFHIDVMDGKFVEKNTVDKMNKYTNILKQITILPLDVHLMVEDVETYVKLYSAIEPNIITFHLEACKDKEEVHKIIKLIRENNCKVGIAIKPTTDIKDIYEFLPYINTVLIMTVEPGKGGQSLISETLRKIKILKEYLNQNNLDTYIEADGGINIETIEEVKDAGVDIAVVGNGILKTENYEETIKKLKA
ncbi:MAG TPA: ribulose-phosphate 3-epimerase [Clostridiaceae bacterium]|nr:ribulose-phosphate 3-epimerase [Clostridium sp.]HJJ13067.1 ribulose-phosphate 3-epimerase [Clostridiaceae bacterium]